jgi:hypothetical protein
MTPLERFLVTVLIVLTVLGLGAFVRTARQVVDHAIVAPIQAVSR